MNQDEHHKLLLVQSDCGDGHENLIKSAQYCIQDMRPSNSSQHHVVFIVQLPRVAGACFTGFLVGAQFINFVSKLVLDVLVRFSSFEILSECVI